MDSSAVSVTQVNDDVLRAVKGISMRSDKGSDFEFKDRDRAETALMSIRQLAEDLDAQSDIIDPTDLREFEGIFSKLGE